MIAVAARDDLDAVREKVRSGLLTIGRDLSEAGMAGLGADGKLIRPVVAWVVARWIGGGDLPPGFWQAAAAVQLAHEASLVHDDVIDDARERRGVPTLVAERGVAAAVVAGDHLLTSAYRVAAMTGSAPFMASFARSVERTVAGEIRQSSAGPAPLAMAEYREAVREKSGELLGCALAAPAVLSWEEASPELHRLGTDLGILYQLLDDLLDYCPDARTGKRPFNDHGRGQWTWPLTEAPDISFEDAPAAVARRMRSADRPDGSTPLRRCLDVLEAEAAAFEDRHASLLGDEPLLPRVVGEWLRSARRAVAAASAAGESGRPRAAATRPTRIAVDAAALPAPADAVAFMAHHSRSFRFAARLFPRDQLERVAAVYAYCRHVDDLVDHAPPGRPAEVARVLDDWLAASRSAWDGEATGIPLLDAVMRDAARSGVPFAYAEELVRGVRMDLDGAAYRTMAELRVYTYRVASIVGLWLTELFGVHDAAVLERAAALGHAMQLTNILRDVGEDLESGRVYLPAEALRSHDLEMADLVTMRRTGVVHPRYPGLIEDVMAEADAAYRSAFAAIPALPRFFQRPVAVAADVYRGIHDAIRHNGYDNLTRRARTSGPAKVRLAAGALWRLRRMPNGVPPRRPVATAGELARGDAR